MASFHLRLDSEAFFQLTPRQLQLLLHRHREKTRSVELLAGIIASTIANCSPLDRKEPFTPGHFMPSQWGKPDAQQTAVEPTEERRRRVAAQTAAFFNRLVKQ